MSDKSNTAFLTPPLGVTYAKTALPIIFVMGMNGLLAVADALFLGFYVGPDALAAVTLMFPVYMLIVALATLVASGMSSHLARLLGGGLVDAARDVFAGAHGLALLVGVALMAMFFLLGAPFALVAAAGRAELAELGLIYLRITVLFSPLLFILSVHSDALRNEGRAGFMAGMSLLVSLANIGFNYVLIALLDMGVAGSAIGTALAQALSLAIIFGFRLIGDTPLPLTVLIRHRWAQRWQGILALGAPQSLNFIGFALGAAAVIAALQMVKGPNYDATVTAFGIITRVMTFVFLPLLGLSHAMQTITGTNFGAGEWQRSDDSLRLALAVSFVYGLLVQGVMTFFPNAIGAAFVEDAKVIGEVARILPVMAISFTLAGPLMMIAMHFQAIGDATRAGILGLTKPYLFALPLTFILAAVWGDIGIWLAGPVSEVCLLILTFVVLRRIARRSGLHMGLFRSRRGETA